MTDLFTTTESSALLDLAVRATIVLSVAMAFQWLTRREPAAIRHHLWTMTFALLLLLPVLRLFGPSWEVPLLPQASGPTEEPRFEALEHGASVVSSAGTLVPVAADAPEARGTVEAPEPRRLVQLAFVLWGIGCGAAFISVGAGIWRFHRLVRGARPVENEAWLGQLDALRKRLSVRAEVRLVLAQGSVTPMTGGVLRPVILLPASATAWSEARRHVVLAHELVHVRRRDALRQLLGRTVLALYWFHPASWVASHLAAARREEACDEEVLAVGARPSEYANHLLSLAESGSLRRPALSLPMAQQSRLERRVRAILSPHRPRPRAAVAAVALVAVAVGGVSVSIANPTRPEDVPGVVGEAVSVDPGALQCVPASEADQLSGWDFSQGLGEVLVCTIQGETLATAGKAARTIESADWVVLESEIRKQLGGAVHEEGTAGSRRKTR